MTDDHDVDFLARAVADYEMPPRRWLKRYGGDFRMPDREKLDEFRLLMSDYCELKREKKQANKLLMDKMLCSIDKR